jgi:hypothetical protein
MVHLPGSKAFAVLRDERDHLLVQVREKILDFVGPTYILDQSYHFVDWNPTYLRYSYAALSGYRTACNWIRRIR